MRVNVPAWIFSRPAIYAGVLIAFLGTVGVWFAMHDAKVRQQALADERDAKYAAALIQQRETIQHLNDSLTVAKNHTNTITKYVTVAAKDYTEQRGRINTDPKSQPTGTPPGMVVVPASFVTTADSMAALIPKLMEAMDAERDAAAVRIAASDSAVAILTAEVEQLKIAVKAAKPSLADKAKTAAIGGAVVYVGVQIVKSLIGGGKQP